MPKKLIVIATIVVPFLLIAGGFYLSSRGFHLRKIDIFNRASVVTGGRRKTLEKARVTVMKAPLSIPRGETWSALLSTNSWASCTASWSEPNTNSGAFKDRTTTQVPVDSLGRGTFSWTVPKDAPVGHYIMTFVCGITGNTAVNVRGFDVK